jgi:hypothetical protein
MTLTPLESQFLASSVFAIPTIGLLLYAVARGHFRRSENSKYLVFTSPEEDYWEQDWGCYQPASAPEGGDRDDAQAREG